MALFKSPFKSRGLFWLVILLNFCFSPPQPCESVKVLFYAGLASHSHLVATEPFAAKMAEQGHQVTFFTPYDPIINHPNVTYYRPKVLTTLRENYNVNLGLSFILTRVQGKHRDYVKETPSLWFQFVDACEAITASEEYKNWVETSHFDLVVLDFVARECGLIPAHKWGAKKINFSPVTMFAPDFEAFGFPTESSVNIPMESEDDYFSDAYIHEIRILQSNILRRYFIFPKYDEIAQKNGYEMPPIAVYEKTIDLYMSNFHFSMEPPRSLPPFVVPIGGIHCRDSKPVTDKVIKKFVEDPNSDGFIYIGFGSICQISALPQEKLEVFWGMMKSFPGIKFLFKWEGSEFPKEAADMPNVLFSKWVPQQDILGHPRIRAFVSHGGQMSFQEAVYHGVPLIIMPTTFDQILNARLSVKMGVGIHLEFSEITKESFSGAVSSILSKEGQYTQKMKRLAKLTRDRPMSAVDTAVWWAEYVLRHDDLSHLKPPAIHQSWWEKRLLHIWFAFFLIALVVLGVSSFLLFLLTKYILRLLKRKIQGESKSSPNDSDGKKKQ